jgi:hypothetical protein
MHVEPEKVEQGVRLSRLLAILREVLVAASPFHSCWEFDHPRDHHGEEWHAQLTELSTAFPNPPDILIEPISLPPGTIIPSDGDRAGWLVIDTDDQGRRFWNWFLCGENALDLSRQIRASLRKSKENTDA